MNRHLAIKTSCFSVVKLRKATAPAHASYLRPAGNSPARIFGYGARSTP